MADSEVKARRKLEEAEKKCRGGGGLLGKIFGGSGSDEAADLFVQSGVQKRLRPAGIRTQILLFPRACAKPFAPPTLVLHSV
ncbi:hypothetical protein KIN20_013149 [Parelaphostrongylus tenuis]|uniref:Uncharacterized protein n=1 Tax=Parelaphostrongylus tenuis TaxID=148309 RepID=A0AAD5MD31_PARTN|nr:hypothetical protein KIN20_013149 [Parelaphostrongylus tenuis]